MNSKNNDRSDFITNLIAILRDFSKLLDLNGDEYKSRAYATAANNLSKTKEFKTAEELKSTKIAGIGKGIAEKIIEFNDTGKIQEYETLRASTPIELFGVLGAGDKTVKQWIATGIRSLADLQKSATNGKIKLTRQQAAGLKYYDDLNERIPRNEVTIIGNRCHEWIKQLAPDCIFEIVGSYKRGSPTCGDIDCLVAPANAGDYMPQLLDELASILPLDPDFITIISAGRERLTLLYRSDISGKVRQIDILYVTKQSWAAALLYFTGSYELNRIMRGIAQKKGYRLNQSGLYKVTKSGKLTLVKTPTEADIFRILGMKYLIPSLR